MSATEETITSFELARAIAVEPQAIHNWARRHPDDFPLPSYPGGSKAYPMAAILAWLDQRRIPRSGLASHEGPGTTYGDRLRANRQFSSLLPAPDPFGAVPSVVTQVKTMLETILWQPLLQLWRGSGLGASLELMLFLLRLRARDGSRWGELAAAGKAEAQACLDAALRAHVSGSPEIASALMGIRPDLWSSAELHEIVALVEKSANRVSRHRISVREFSTITCDFLLERVAAAGGRPDSEYFTPPDAAQLMVELLAPQAGERICDPCCGSGELLVAAAGYVREQGGSNFDDPVHGFALGEHSRRLAMLNASLHGLVVDLGRRPVDVLLEHVLPSPYNVILTNPPFNKRGWSVEDPARDAARWPYGIPPAHNSNFAWLQHIVSMLAEDGRAAVVMPDSTVSTNIVSQRKIRAAMVEAGVVRAVIALPPRLFRQTRISASIWMVAARASSAREEILFIDASMMGSFVGRKYRTLTRDGLMRIVRSYREWSRSRPGEYRGDPGFAATATLEQVRARNHHLGPSVYLAADSVTTDIGDVGSAVRSMYEELVLSHVRASAADVAVDRHLRWIEAWIS